ncbi:GNAT family N-acetyltransferase [Oceaniglobus indicus]|uniref:GNAT family N-acetyltransferase n=1 Tax=Oceaniglobus indicus TaxID=2047749 RepID=UPI000C197113|nr:GNAT family N-acetyltransferase [Oceaniglobus indicus]
MSDLAIRHEASGTRHRLVVNRHGAEAELTYTVVAPGRVIADHTGVPDAFRGEGVGPALVARLVADARKDGFVIVPRCRFIEAQRRRHPEWSNVFST